MFHFLHNFVKAVKYGITIIPRQYWENKQLNFYSSSKFPNIFNDWYESCVSASLISDICTSSTKTGNELYVWNDGYPDTSGDCATSSGCVCSVSATKGSTIQVDLLDLRLYEDGVGTCYQRLVISEGGLETSVDCAKKNEFALTPIYTSQSDSFDIRFDNTHSGQSGNFWIALRGNIYLQRTCVHVLTMSSHFLNFTLKFCKLLFPLTLLKSRAGN